MVKFHEDAYWPKNLSLLQSVVSTTEDPKNKIMRKSGIHGSVPCWEQYFKTIFVLMGAHKIEKYDVSWGLSFM